jgi:hypothetical protein
VLGGRRRRQPDRVLGPSPLARPVPATATATATATSDLAASR